MDIQERLESLRRFQYLLDSAFRVPGTRLRFGWDPIVGLVPWLGDLLTALFSAVLLVQANRMRVPRVIQAKMLLNTAIDILAGMIPFAGDLSDMVWKSNARNFALLERHAGGLSRPTPGDWLFVAGLLGAIVATALIPVFFLLWVVARLTSV